MCVHFCMHVSQDEDSPLQRYDTNEYRETTQTGWVKTK